MAAEGEPGEDANEDDVTDEEIAKGDDEEFACRPDDGELPARARSARTPGQPSKAEREMHDLTHCPPRSWCEHCMKGQAKDDAHVRIAGELATRIQIGRAHV